MVYAVAVGVSAWRRRDVEAKNAQIRQVLAHKNAQCDKDILDIFVKNGRDRDDEVAKIIEDNARENLDAACSCISNIIRGKVAASVKIVLNPSVLDREPELARLQTILRDSVSQEKRGGHDRRIFDVRENTATKAILVHHAHDWVCDDLNSNRAYENSRRGLLLDYNATRTIPIALLQPGTKGVRACGLLHVDSMVGGLSDVRVLQIMQETQCVWRFCYTV